MQKSENVVIIVSGGLGSRMKNETPKQYLSVSGKPILAWTIEKFLTFDRDISIILVLGEGHHEYWEEIKNSEFADRDILVGQGGSTRFGSVFNGLKLVDESCIVGIHDAVRPLVSKETIKSCYESAIKSGSGIPVAGVEDTIRTMKGENSMQLERQFLRRVQTPQVFNAAQLKNAYTQPYSPDFTDDAAVYERKYGSVNLVDGNRENIKITHPADLKIAAAFLG